MVWESNNPNGVFPFEAAVPAEALLLERHHRQIHERPRWLSRRLCGLAALLVWRHGRYAPAPTGLDALSTNTVFVLSPVPGRNRSGHPAQALLLRGYRTSWDATVGRIVLGSRLQNVCGFDLRFRPFPDAKGKILSTRRLSLLHIGLQLDAALQTAALDRDRKLPIRPPLPDYWLGFAADQLPSVPDNSATRQAALRTIGTAYAGPILPCLRGPGGLVTDLVQAADGTHVLFNDDQVIRLPSQAVLRPVVQVGQRLPAGFALGDFLPRQHYPHWTAVVGALGPPTARWLLREAVQAWDLPHAGLICRRTEFIARPVQGVRGIFEDLRPLLGEAREARASAIFLWRTHSPHALCFDRPGLHVDFHGLHPQWEPKFRLPEVHASAKQFVPVPSH